MRDLFFVGGLELELTSQAFGIIHVIPNPEINGLEQHAALFETVEIADFDDLTGLRDVVIGGNGDVAARYPAIFAQQLQFDTALTIDLGDHSTQGSDELVLQLIAAAVGSARGVGRIHLLEHDAFAFTSLQLIQQRQLLFCGKGCFHELNGALLDTEEQVHQRGQPFTVRPATNVHTIQFKQVEGKQIVPDALAVNGHIRIKAPHHIKDRQR